jgi:hypothetical protein
MAPIDPEAGAALLSSASLGNPILGNPGGGPQLPSQPQGVGPLAGPGQGAAPQAPEVDTSGAPYGASILSSLQAKGSPFVKDLAKFTEGTAKAAPPGAMQQPGTWAKSLVGGALSALGGVASSLGDVAHANDNYRPGQGGLSGIANVMAARNQRQAQQKAQLSKDDTEKALKAEAVARTVRLYYDMKNSDQKTKNELAASDAATIKANEESHDTENNLSQSQIDQFEKDNPQWFDNYKIAITGWKPSVDANGKPVIDPKSESQIYEPVYARQNLKAKDGVTTDYTLTKAMADDFTRAGTPMTEGQKVPISQFNAAWPKVQQFNLAEKAAREANEGELDEQNKSEVKGLLQDTHVSGAVTAGALPLVGVNQMLDNIAKAVPQLQARVQQLQAKNPNDLQIAQLQKNIQDKTDLQAKLARYKEIGVTDKQRDEYTKYQEKEQADAETAKQRAETERHNRADEANKAAEVQMKKLNEKANFKGDPNAATPAEFMNSLDPDARAAVQLVGTGRAPLNRADYLLARNPDFLNAVAKAYPDFDVSKVKSYQDAYKDFTSGKTADSLQHGSIAIGHLQRLKQINDENPIAVHNPATAAYKEYNNLLDTVAGELIAFYHEPSTNESRAAKKATLGGLVNRDAAIQEQAKAMAVKLDSFKTRWANAAPSAVYQAQMPDITPQAKAAIQTLLGGQQQPAAPKANPFRQQQQQVNQ